MKRIKIFVITLIAFFCGLTITNAASLKVSANKTNVIVGSNVTITVSASGAAGWEYCLNYDSSMFTLKDTTSDTGGKCVKTGSTLTGSSKVTYTLKATKSGSSTVSLDSAAMYKDDGSTIDFSKGSVSIKARTQAEIEASYSTNANLKSLEIEGYELTPAFAKDISSYSLEVPNEVESITINATKDDSSATVSGDGVKELTEGLNKFEIVVTAEKGNKKTYTVDVTRKELNPITVTVDNEEMTVIRKTDAIEVPAYYTLGEIEIKGETVPALKSDITGYTLVALKNEAGDIHLYAYNESDNTYSLYKYINSEGFTFISLPAPNIIEEYGNVKQIEVNDLKIDSYAGLEASDIVLVYGMNAKTGEKGWYKYDTVEGTFQRYLTDEVSDKNSQLYFMLTIIFASLSGLTIILLIVIMMTNSKIRKKNSKLVELLQASRKQNANNKTSSKEETKEEVKKASPEEQHPKEKVVSEETVVGPVKAKINNETVELKLSQRETNHLEKEEQDEEKTKKIAKVENDDSEKEAKEKKIKEKKSRSNREEKK